MIEVDGSYGEGGGQILRMAVALSALKGIPIRVTRIRSGRSDPGLAAQHVTAVQSVAQLCNAELEGLEIGSSEISFRPGSIAAGRFSFDVGTAGSITLVLQACLPVALSAAGPVQIRLIGGTDVRWSPPVDYCSRVFLPLLRRCGGHIDLILHRRGYYPRGGGAVEVLTRPTPKWDPIDLSSRGPIHAIRGISHVSNLSPEIPKRIKHAAMRRLHGLGKTTIEERVYSGDEAIGQGGAIVLWAEAENVVLGSAILAERGKPSERVGEEAASLLRADLETDATMDVHASDQMLVYLALADGPSTFLVREVSNHLRTMAWLIRMLTDREVTWEGQRSLWRVAVSGPRG